VFCAINFDYPNIVKNIQSVWEHLYPLPRKQSILEKNILDKSGVLNNPFSDLIDLSFDGITKIRAMSLKIF